MLMRKPSTSLPLFECIVGAATFGPGDTGPNGNGKDPV